MNSQHGLFATAALVAFSISGCGTGHESLPPLQAAVGKALGNSRSAALATEPTLVSTSFEPSYPDRSDPFSFPNGAAIEGSGIDTSIKSAAHVDVVGFADLGTPRVFLRAREKTYSLVEGESIYGVEVLEIRPPVVRLRMGTLRWNATMFDKSSATPRR